MHIDAVGKGDGHYGEAGNGFGAQRGKSGGAVHRVFDLSGDQFFDLLRRESGRFGLNVHLRRHEFRKDIERRLHGSPEAEHQRQQGEQADRAVIADA